MSGWIARTLLAAAALASIAASGQSVSPANPVAGEDFVARVNWSGCGPIGPTTYTVDGSVVFARTEFTEPPGCFATPPGGYKFIVVNLATPGTYRLQHQQGSRAVQDLGTFEVAPAAPPANPARTDLTGLWWDPAKPGEAINVTQGETGQLFVFWYAPGEYQSWGGNFSSSGFAPWLVMSTGRWVSPTQFRGLLSRALGPPVAVPSDSSSSAQVTIDVYTVATISVAGPDALVFQQALEPPRTLRRFQF